MCCDSFSQRVREQFWANVEQGTDGCWQWSGARDKNGYGRLQWSGALFSAHRLAYELLVGAIPDGLFLDHLCENKACVNPDHLEPVTPRENVLRGLGLAAQNARKTHCLQGHPYDQKNTDVFNGSRHCRECVRVNSREYYRRLNGIDTTQQRGEYGKRRQTCPNGHPYEGDNIYVAPGDGHRWCRTCKNGRERTRRRQLAKIGA